jgi:HJR/Mrr/RecB family endonuclease
MTASVDLFANLKLLDNAITNCATRVSTYHNVVVDLRRQMWRNRWTLTYLRLARCVRAPAATYSLWELGLFLVGAAMGGVTAFIVCAQLLDTYKWAIAGALIVAAAADGLIYALMRYPSDSHLSIAISDTISALNDTQERRKPSLAKLTQCSQELSNLKRERSELLSSISWKRATLLQQNWKAMRDSEWEEFLVQVFNALGANAKRIGKAGDQGVDLIVEHCGRRIAVQAKGYYNAVNNKAVQEAVAGKAHHGCCTSAVITNSRFGRSAIELALSNNCILIGEDQFPDFVMGAVEYFQDSRVSPI